MEQALSKTKNNIGHDLAKQKKKEKPYLLGYPKLKSRRTTCNGNQEESRCKGHFEPDTKSWKL